MDDLLRGGCLRSLQDDSTAERSVCISRCPLQPGLVTHALKLGKAQAAGELDQGFPGRQQVPDSRGGLSGQPPAARMLRVCDPGAQELRTTVLVSEPVAQIAG